jgi:hypothetical protein
LETATWGAKFVIDMRWSMKKEQLAGKHYDVIIRVR